MHAKHTRAHLLALRGRLTGAHLKVLVDEAAGLDDVALANDLAPGFLFIIVQRRVKAGTPRAPQVQHLQPSGVPQTRGDGGRALGPKGASPATGVSTISVSTSTDIRSCKEKNVRLVLGAYRHASTGTSPVTVVSPIVAMAECQLCITQPKQDGLTPRSGHQGSRRGRSCPYRTPQLLSSPELLPLFEFISPAKN
jgi:hypothetical protein